MAKRCLTESRCLKWMYSYDPIPLLDPPENAEEKVRKCLAKLFPDDETCDRAVLVTKMLEVLPNNDGKDTFAYALSLCQDLADLDDFIGAFKRFVNLLRAKGRTPSPYGFVTSEMSPAEALARVTPFSQHVPCFNSNDPLKDPLFISLKKRFEELLSSSTLETAGKEDERIFENFSELVSALSTGKCSVVVETPNSESASYDVPLKYPYINEQSDSGLTSTAKTPRDPAGRCQAYLRFLCLLRSQQKASIPMTTWERQYSMKHTVLRSCTNKDIFIEAVEVAHIIPFSSATFTDEDRFKSKHEIWFFMLRLFPHLRGRMPENSHVNCLENILLMSNALHREFDEFHWALHQTTIPNEYDVKTHAKCDGPVEQVFNSIGWKVKFTTSDSERLPVPHPDLLALHAAIAQLAHMKGFAEETEEDLFHDEGCSCFATDGHGHSGLATNGSTDIERLLAATVLPSLEAKSSRASSTANASRISSSADPKQPLPIRDKLPGLENEPPGP